MDNQIDQYPSTAYCEYALVVQPDVSVSSLIQEEQLAFPYQQPKLVFNAHIPILEFFAQERMEETIIRYTERICNQQKTFNVVLNNFGGKPTGSLHIRVQDAMPFKVLARELKVVGDYITSCSCPGIKFEPAQVTIARQIPNDVLTTVLLTYAQRSFHKTFMANELVLLRRDHPYQDFKKVYVFRLQPAGD